ncbi:hypothetical protein ACFL19_00770 [Pseudomonadota bacterium]
MKCDKCGERTIVIDSRTTEGYIRRRRKCERCGERFSTSEFKNNSDIAHEFASKFLNVKRLKTISTQLKNSHHSIDSLVENLKQD